MLIHTANTRNITHIAIAKRQSPTSSDNNQRLKTWAATANTGFATRRKGHVLKMASVATLVLHL